MGGSTRCQNPASTYFLKIVNKINYFFPLFVSGPKMKWFILVTVLFSCLSSIVCPPVKEQPNPKEGKADTLEEQVLGFEYERYLKEVFNALEEDENFKKRVSEAESKGQELNGDIAHHLE